VANQLVIATKPANKAVSVQVPRPTPTTDTNGLGRWQPEMDILNALSEASDGAGHLGRALQAGDHGCRDGEAAGRVILPRHRVR
jgi:hypothetical protein